MVIWGKMTISANTLFSSVQIEGHPSQKAFPFDPALLFLWEIMRRSDKKWLHLYCTEICQQGGNLQRCTVTSWKREIRLDYIEKYEISMFSCYASILSRGGRRAEINFWICFATKILVSLHYVSIHSIITKLTKSKLADLAQFFLKFQIFISVWSKIVQNFVIWSEIIKT